MAVDLGVDSARAQAFATAAVISTSSRVLAEVIAAAYNRLGFTVLADEGECCTKWHIGGIRPRQRPGLF